MFAKLKAIPFVIVTFSSAVLVAGISFAATSLHSSFSRIATSIKALETDVHGKLDALNKAVAAVMQDLKEIGTIGHVTALRREIKEIVRERETTLDLPTDKEGRRYTAKTIMRQVLTRARPGPPIDRFPTHFITDCTYIDFQDINYQILTPQTAKFLTYERLLIADGKVRFVIHNLLLKPLVFAGEAVELTYSSAAKTVDPHSDWVGVIAGGFTELVRIKLWFPPGQWHIEHAQAYKGPPPANVEPGGLETVVFPIPVVGQDVKDGVNRTFISWERATPDPDESYCLAWKATELH
jgi:hypothetical protein